MILPAVKAVLKIPLTDVDNKKLPNRQLKQHGIPTAYPHKKKALNTMVEDFSVCTLS